MSGPWALVEQCEYGHGPPVVIVLEAHCSECGMEFVWTTLHGEGHYELPFMAPAECFRAAESLCATCKGRVLIATEVP